MNKSVLMLLFNLSIYILTFSQQYQLIKPFEKRLFSKEDIGSVINLVNSQLMQDKMIGSNALMAGDSLYKHKRYDLSILEYYRAKYYLRGEELVVDDSLDNYIFRQIALSYRNLNNLQKSDSLLSILSTGKYKESRYKLIENLILEDRLKVAKSYIDYYSLSGYDSLLSQYNCIIDSLKYYKKNRPKSENMAFYISTIVPGSGFIYNREYKRGALTFLADVPMAIFLGDRLNRAVINYNKEKYNESKIYVTDFLIFFVMVFKRYWIGETKEAYKSVALSNKKYYNIQKRRLLIRYGI